MVEVEVQETISCAPEAWLEFVLDVERYAAVDDKIGPISWVRRKDQLVEFKFLPKLPGLQLPALRIVSQMRLTPGRRIDVRLAPLPRNISSHLASGFKASFSCLRLDGALQVTRSIEFQFSPGVRRMVEPVLRDTLPISVERELRLTKQILEGSLPRA